MERPDNLNLGALRALPGLEVTFEEPRNYGESSVDTILRVTSQAGRSRYLLEVKSNVTTASLGLVLSQLERQRSEFALRPLLAAPYLTPGVTERLLHHGIEFVDDAGNVHLNGPAAYVLILGRKPENLPRSGALSTADLRLIFALLARPELRAASYRVLNAYTGVSLGKISGTIKKLEIAKYVARAPSGSLLLREPKVLLERWDIGYLELLRPALSPTKWRRVTPTSFEEIAGEAKKVEGVLIGGEYVADLLTGHLKPASIALHVPSGRSKAVAASLRLVPAEPSGDIVLIERFAPKVDAAGTSASGERLRYRTDESAHPILVRSELLANDDARLREVAGILLRDVILPTLDDATA
ncbi:MAG TPA: type IV toxin-antitoxin system AbiEi family antitoxin [Trueperaceae bacterium]|nr:type IV toxin-antitoxin system AbiEi family antitoxin [Trueperaceae bacterium]